MSSFDASSIECVNNSQLLYFQTPGISPPTTIAPGTTSDTGFAVADLTPSFSWNTVAGASRYGLYISKSPYGAANLVYQNTTLTSSPFAIPAGNLVNGTKYRWQMTQFDANGTESANNSQLLYFQTPGISPPTT